MSKKVRMILATTIAVATMMSFAGCSINIDKDLAERIASEVSEAVENGDIEINVDDKDNNDDKDTDDSEAEATEATVATEEAVCDDGYEATDNPYYMCDENGNPVPDGHVPLDVRNDIDQYIEDYEGEVEVINYCPISDFLAITYSAYPIEAYEEYGQPVLFTGLAHEGRVTSSQIFPFFEGDEGIYIRCQTAGYYNPGDTFYMTVYRDGEYYCDDCYTMPEGEVNTSYAHFRVYNQSLGCLEAGNYYIEFTGYNGEVFARTNVVVSPIR